jgi:TRAP-type C4-dicarboxylate transport system substrate-binding protein
MCNRAQYESWPEDVRRAVDQAAAEATTLQRQLAAAEDEEMLKRLDPSQNEVVKLTVEEHHAFAVAVSPVTDKYRKEFGASFFAMLD